MGKFLQIVEHLQENMISHINNNHRLTFSVTHQIYPSRKFPDLGPRIENSWIHNTAQIVLQEREDPVESRKSSCPQRREKRTFQREKRKPRKYVLISGNHFIFKRNSVIARLVKISHKIKVEAFIQILGSLVSTRLFSGSHTSTWTWKDLPLLNALLSLSWIPSHCWTGTTHPDFYFTLGLQIMWPEQSTGRPVLGLTWWTVTAFSFGLSRRTGWQSRRS